MTLTAGIFLVVLLVALAVFGVFLVRRVQYVLVGQPEARHDRLGARAGGFVVYVLGQKKLFKEPVGIVHFIIFWGFIVIAFGALQIIGEGLWEAFSLPADRRLDGLLPRAGRAHGAGADRHRGRRRVPLCGAAAAAGGQPGGGGHPRADLRPGRRRPRVQRLRLRARRARQVRARARHRRARGPVRTARRRRDADRHAGLLVGAPRPAAGLPRLHPAEQAPAPHHVPGQRVLPQPQAARRRRSGRSTWRTRTSRSTA